MSVNKKYTPVRQGIMSRWHSFSTQKPNITVPGTEAEDIIEILKNINKKYKIDIFASLCDDLLSHTVNYENPHDDRIEDLPESVFDKLYEFWLLEGYKGTKDTLRNAIFKYIEIANMTEQIEGTSEIKVPPVKVVYDYLQLHNKDQHAHEDIFNNILYGSDIYRDPGLVVNYLSNVHYSYKSYWNGIVYNVPMVYFQNVATVCINWTSSLQNLNILSLTNGANVTYRISIQDTNLLVHHNHVIIVSQPLIGLSEQFRMTLYLHPINGVIYVTDIKNQIITKKFTIGDGERSFNNIQFNNNFNRNGLNELSIYFKNMFEQKQLDFLSK